MLSSPVLSALTRISSAETYDTSPVTRETITIPESLAAWASNPVPTRGRSGRNNGTA